MSLPGEGSFVGIQKHTQKTLERVKAKEPTGVKEIWMEQPQQVRGDRLHPKGTCSIPAGTTNTILPQQRNLETSQRKHLYLFFLL